MLRDVFPIHERLSVAQKKTSTRASESKNEPQVAGSVKRSKPKIKNPARNAAELKTYAKQFLDWAVETSGTMSEGAYRLEQFDPEFRVTLITSMLDKFRDEITRRVNNQFGKEGKLTDDIDKERARREIEKILKRKRPD